MHEPALQNLFFFIITYVVFFLRKNSKVVENEDGGYREEAQVCCVRVKFHVQKDRLKTWVSNWLTIFVLKVNCIQVNLVVASIYGEIYLVVDWVTLQIWFNARILSFRQIEIYVESGKPN